MMHWWNSEFSSSSKSHSQDDSIIRYSQKPGFFSSRRKLRHRMVTKLSASQQLPLPELGVMLQRDPKFASSGFPSVPLPSPRDTAQMLRENGGSKERDIEMTTDAVDGVDGVKRFAGQETRNYVDRSETRSSRKLQQKKNVEERSSQSYSISIPSSAPTSPYSSPSLSSPGSDMMNQPTTPPGVFQVWSAPEIPHSDRNLGFGYYWPAMRTASSLDNSPLESPGRSTQHPTTSPPRPASPFSSTVHPLPLPPGASQPVTVSPVTSMPFQSNPISSNAAIPEFSPVASEPKLRPIKSQWQKGKLIGRGTFGSVYVASNRRTGALCAMKEVEILPDDSKSAESMRQLEQEIKVLSHLKHLNIVQYYGSEIVRDKFHIYLEYVHPGPINKFIQDHFGAITESVVRNFTRHILCGLAYLHSKKTIHRDIKGANLLVDAYGVVKLADFGMAKHLNGQATVLSLKGSPYWLAPELMQPVKQKNASSEVGLAVDIWSLGCTIIEMMSGKPPWSEYEGPAAIFKALQETPPIPETMSAVGKDFLHCCFWRNPADRPTASKLLEHPFVSYSQHPDACFQKPKERRLSDNMKFLREPRNHKLNQVPASFDTLIKKGRMDTNFMHDSFSPARLSRGGITKHPI